MLARCWGIAILIFILCAAQSLGQTSQPSSRDVPIAWQETVATLSKALTEGTDEAAAVNLLNEIIPTDAAILKFASTDPESRYSLRQQSNGLAVVSIHAYGWPMETFASDLTSDLRNCDSMPDTVRRAFTPRDDAETKRANTTAQQWVNALLHPTNDQFVAVIVLWQPPPSIEARLVTNAAAASTEEKQPVFILVKGKKTDDDQIRITQLVFGDAKQALN